MPSNYPYMSLRAKLVAFALAVLLPIAGLVVFEFRQETQRQVQSELNSELQVARAIALLVDETFDRALGIAAALAVQPAVQNMRGAEVAALLSQLISQYPQYDCLLLYNRQGENIAAAFAREGESIPKVADQPFFRSALETGQPIVSEVRRENPTDRPIVLVAVPVTNPRDQVVGVMMIEFATEELGRKIADAGLPPHQDVFLADQNGRIGLHTGRSDLSWEERMASNWMPVADALRGKVVQMHAVRSPFRDNSWTVAAVRGGQHGWVVGVSEPEERLMAPVWDSLRDHLAWFLPTLGFACVLAIMLSRSLTAPLRELTSAHSDVQGGRLGRRVDLRTGDEVETLARSFNRTVEQMERITRERAEFEQLRAEFVSMVAHDLRTPLVAIVGWADVLGRSIRGHEELDREQKAIEHLRSSARRLDAMISDLLDASRIETSRLQLEKEPCDLGQFVPEVIERLAEVTRGHPVLLAGSGTKLIIQGDPRRIEQILGNLLSNAAKYSYPQTEIMVRLWSQEGQVCCSISNQGQGISPREQEHLFERYYRGGRPLLTAGLGLGLYITKGLVESHGGRIWVESEVGKSATFTFCLPAVA